MKDPLYRMSTATVSFAKLVEAGFYLALALVFVLIAWWLTRAFGLNWFMIGLDIFLGLNAAASFVEACTLYAASQPAERPDERERYLQSRSLYISRDVREARRRKRES